MSHSFFTDRLCRLGRHNWYYLPRENKPPLRYCLHCDEREEAQYDALARKTFWAHEHPTPNKKA